MDQPTSTSSLSTPMISTFDLFKKSFLFIRDNAKKFFYIILIMLGPSLIGQIIKLWLFYFKFEKGEILSDLWTMLLFYFFLAVALISIIVHILGLIALIIFINGNDPDFRIVDVYKEAFKKFFSSLWIIFLTTLIILGGFILFILPGIFWTISYSLSIYILIAENIKGYQALKRSKELIKNYWWPVFLRNINLFLFIFITALPVLILESKIKSNIIFLVEVSYNLIYSFLIIALSIVYSFNIYKDLKKLKGEFKSDIIR